MSASDAPPAAAPAAPPCAAARPAGAAPETLPDGAVRTAPASGLQRGLWVLDRRNPQAAPATTPGTDDVTGPLDLALLRRALDGVS
ncbi:hypothetical protein PUR61_15940, partial [Streptomyces sp. BE20]|uniref:hypothetical protein n=1 Tax=Streptomyces sp. BE20 TaxID=3002525 RepID=UPI002E761487